MNAPDVSSNRSRRGWEYALVAGLVLVHMGLALTSGWQKSATYDEPLHIAGGYGYWAFNDYRLQPENGVLPQRAIGLPVWLFSGVEPLPLDASGWASSDPIWAGQWLLYEGGARHGWMLALGRSANVLMSGLLCVMVYGISRTLFGGAGGLLSLALCVFSPTVLAHGRLATSDVWAAGWLLAGAWSMWQVLHRFSPLWLTLTALSVAAAFLSKATAVLLIALAGVLVACRVAGGTVWRVRGWWWGYGELRGRGRQIAAAIGLFVVVGLVSWGLLWTAYGWRHSAFAADTGEGTFYKLHSVEEATQPLGHAGAVLRWCNDWRLLPEAYVYGLAFVLRHSSGRVAFAAGSWTVGGWWWFFPYAVGIKTPLALFGLLLLSGAAWLCPSHRERSDRSDRESNWLGGLYEALPLWGLSGLVAGLAMASELNIGHRHVLPLYPVLFVLAGGVVRWLSVVDWRGSVLRQMSRPGPLAGMASGGLLLWYATSSLLIWPHFLGYFNEVADGPRQGYRCLVDSSLDWGQDLPALREAVADHRRRGADGWREPVALAYFGTARPKEHAVEARLLLERTVDDVLPPLAPGLYAVSATHLQSVGLACPGPWNRVYEADYWRARGAVRRLRQLARPELVRRLNTPGDPTRESLEAFRALRFGRLAAYLRRQRPVAYAGYGILLFRLDARQLREAMQGAPAELRDSPFAPRSSALPLESARVYAEPGAGPIHVASDSQETRFNDSQSSP